MVFIRQNNNLVLITSLEGIFVIDIKTLKEFILKLPDPILPPNLTKSQIQVLTKESRDAVSFELSCSKKYLGVSLENKQVVIYDSEFNLVKNFIIPRVASKVCFSPTDDLVIADKTGDVTLYPLTGNEKPVLLLGHLSVILDMTFSDCGNFIITCDRDEKIRVSHYPNAYNIASFCLGHTEFVISIRVYGETLISASGDGTIRFWNFKQGEQFNVIKTSDQICDKTLFDSFQKQMDDEKVEVSALPITDMQTCVVNNVLLVAVSVYNFNNLLLYNFDSGSGRHSFYKYIKVTFPYNSQLNESLYVFNNDGLTYCKIMEDNCVLDTTELCTLVNKKCGNFKNTGNNEYLMLYKRKFDNVQDYLEKKKIRINAK